jgi:hypothetical protein
LATASKGNKFGDSSSETGWEQKAFQSTHERDLERATRASSDVSQQNAEQQRQAHLSSMAERRQLQQQKEEERRKQALQIGTAALV